MIISNTMKTKEGLWKLSPSGLYGYTECTSCFWVGQHFKKPPMLPLLLNSAMDSILKFRYDKYRADNTFPPEVIELEGEGITPFLDWDLLNTWRESFLALRMIDEKAGYQLSGKIDDVMLEKDGRLIPSDYKSSGNPPRDDKQKYYRDQLAAYGFMFKKLGYEVSDRAYLLHYFVADKTSPELAVKFNAHVDLVKIGDIDIEKKLKGMVKLLDGPYPGDNLDCDTCTYHSGRMATKN